MPHKNAGESKVLAPQARKKIARSFNCGFAAKNEKPRRGGRIAQYRKLLSPLRALVCFGFTRS